MPLNLLKVAGWRVLGVLARRAHEVTAAAARGAPSSLAPRPRLRLTPSPTTTQSPAESGGARCVAPCHTLTGSLTATHVSRIFDGHSHVLLQQQRRGFHRDFRRFHSLLSSAAMNLTCDCLLQPTDSVPQVVLLLLPAT